MKHPEAAKQGLDEGAEIKDPWLLTQVGRTEAALGMTEHSIRHLEAALQDATLKKGDRRYAQFLLGTLYYKQGRFPDACTTLQGEQRTEPGGEQDPLEVLWRVQDPERDRVLAKAEAFRDKADASFVREILATEDLLDRVRREGHVNGF
jgi:hypothetical protein